MAFNIVIRADTTQVLPAVTKVGDELGKVETKAKTTTDALDKGFKTSSVSAQKAAAAFKSVGDAIRAEALSGVAKSFEGLSSQLEREANILERIRGPMREYKADLDSLDMMLKKGTISAHEYTEEMNRLIEKQGTMQGPQQQAPTAAGGAGLGASAAFLIGGAGLGAGLGEIKSLIDAYQQMQDQYTTLSNAALKFADAGHGVNTIISDQLNLSHQLKGGLDATMALYDAVRDGTDDLNVSYSDQIRLTKTLGEAVQMANHPLDEAGSIMARFSYAMASGKIEGRELKSLMVNVPEIADLWTKSFNTTRLGLRQMVDDGRIRVSDLMRVLMDGGKQQEALDQKFQQRQRTNAQYLDEVQKRAEVLADGGLVTVFERAAAMAQMAQAPIQGVSESVQHLTDDFNKLEKATTMVGISMTQAMASAMHGGTAGAVPFAPGSLESTLLGPVMAAREDLTTLNSLFKSGTIDADTYRKKYDELMTTINHGELPASIKLWEAIHNPMREWSLDVGALNQLLKSGAIDARQYLTELGKLHDPNVTDPNASKIPGYVGGRNMGGVEVAFGYERPGKLPADRSRIGDIKALNPDSGQMQTAAWDQTIDKLMAVQEALSKDRTLTMQWNLELAKLRTSVGDQTWSGFENGMNAINKQIDVSAQATKTLVDGFDSVSNAITDLVTKGTVDFHSMISSMLADMTKLLLFQALRAAIGGGGGSAPGVLGSIPGFAGGGSYMTGGFGGTDSQLNIFRSTPGEQVIVRTPEQQRQAADASPTMHTTVINTVDHRQAALAALQSPEGAAIIKNVIVQSQNQLRPRTR